MDVAKVIRRGCRAGALNMGRVGTCAHADSANKDQLHHDAVAYNPTATHANMNRT